MLTQAQKDYVISRVNQIMGKVFVRVDFDLTTTAAGRFHGNMTMSFNQAIAAANWETFDDTIVHECCHALDFVNNGFAFRKLSNGNNDYHGAYWKELMVSFGKEPRRCHSYVIPNARRQRRWGYTCLCEGFVHQIPTVTHNRIIKGAGRICRECRESLTFTGQEVSA